MRIRGMRSYTEVYPAVICFVAVYVIHNLASWIITSHVQQSKSVSVISFTVNADGYIAILFSSSDIADFATICC